MPDGQPVADVLRLFADCNSTGALQVDGPQRGTFYLERGQIVAVKTDAVPVRVAVVPTYTGGRVPAHVLDATAAMLAQPASAPPRFVNGARLDTRESRSAGACPVQDLLAEVRSALDRLDGAMIGADDSVVVRALTGRGVRLDTTTWPLLGALTRPVTARQIAWSLGLPVVDTVFGVDSLVRQGACDVVRRSPRGQPAAERTENRSATALPRRTTSAAATRPWAPSHAAQPPSHPAVEERPSGRRPPEPATVAPVLAPGLAPLPHRSPGRNLTGAPPQPVGGLPLAMAAPDVVLMQRLLDGLRRL